MSKKIPNRADELAFHALKKAFEENKIHLCLVESKINRPSSPVYNPWEVLLPILIPVVLGLILILAVGPIFGLFFMVAMIMVSSNLVRKKLEQKLLERTRAYLLSDYDNFCRLWAFGGIVLVNAENKKLGCIAPDGDWKEFVIKNFADLMVDKAEQSALEAQPEKAEKPKDEPPAPETGTSNARSRATGGRSSRDRRR